MKIVIHVENLIVDGRTDLGRDRAALGRALQAEVAPLLAGGAPPPRAASARAGAIHALAHDVARAVSSAVPALARRGGRSRS